MSSHNVESYRPPHKHTNSGAHTGFDEEGHPVLTQEFDWSSVDEVPKNLKADRKQVRRMLRSGELTQEDFDRALILCATLFRWIWQNGKRDTRGLALRSIIVAWHMLAELRDAPLTQIAARFGKHKQSLGRWVDDFKVLFPLWRIRATRHATATRRGAHAHDARLICAHTFAETLMGVRRAASLDKTATLSSLAAFLEKLRESLGEKEFLSTPTKESFKTSKTKNQVYRLPSPPVKN